MKVVHAQGCREATLTGHVLYLEPGVETELPDFMVTLAIANGAKIVGDEPAPEPTTVLTPPPPPVTETDHEKLVRIMKDIIARGVKDEFRADNTPKTAILNRMFGKVVPEELRAAAWAEATKVE